MKVWGFLLDWAPRRFSLWSLIQSLAILLTLECSQQAPALVSAPSKLQSSLFACFFSFEGDSLPCGLNSLMQLGRGIDFQFVQSLSCWECRSDNFQAFYMSGRETEIPSLVFFGGRKTQNKTFELKNSWQFCFIAGNSCTLLLFNYKHPSRIYFLQGLSLAKST